MEKNRNAGIFLYSVAVLIFLYTGFSLAATLERGFSLIGRPFPGFLLAYNGMVHQYNLPNWTGWNERLKWPHIVTEVNGKPFTSSEDLKNMVESVPVGEVFKYKIYKGLGEGIKESEVATMLFGWRDFLQVYGLNFLIGAAFFLSALIYFILRPNTPLSWAIIVFFCGYNYMSGTHAYVYEFFNPWMSRFQYYMEQFGICGVGAYTFTCGLLIFHEPEFFKKDRRRYLIFFGISFMIMFLADWGMRTNNYNLAYFAWNYMHIVYAAAGLSYLAFIAIKTRYTSMEPIIRQRAKMVLFGMSMASLSGAIAAIMLLLGSPFSYSFLLLPTIGLPITIIYSALSSNLFEVDAVVKRTVIYAGVVIISGFFYAALFQMLQIIFSRFNFYGNYLYEITYLIVLIMILSRIKTVIQSGIDRAFFRTKINYEKVIEDVRHKLSVITDRAKIFEAIRDVTVENLFLSDVDILLADGEGNFHSIEKKNVLKKEDDLCKLIMEKNQLISKSDILNDPKLRPVRNRCLAKLAYLESVFLLPINFKEEMMGIMALGERKSGDITFNLQDIEVLHFLSVQASTAFENARLYEEAEEAKKEIEKMNVILEARVAQRTAELEARAKDLEEQNAHIAFITHNKSAFLASMSHELRTPLNGIIGFSDMAVEGVYGQINPVAKDVLIDLAFNGRELLQLINDILDLSKIEAGKMDIKMEDYSPRDAVDVAMGGWMNECEKKGIKVETEYAPDLPMGWGEGKRVKQVLDTLLRNAVRWSQTKRITIRVTCAPEHQGTRKKVLLFEVEDYGVGIEEYRMPKLFVEHEYPQILDLKYYKNVGVGLALSKKWAELHGGTMWAESTEGKGSKFSFTMPLREYSAQDQEAGSGIREAGENPELENEIKKIISETIKIPIEKLNASRNIFVELGIESIVALQIQAAVEERFNVSIPVEAAAKIQSIRDLARIIGGK